jgi:hypothetical protein
MSGRHGEERPLAERAVRATLVGVAAGALLLAGVGGVAAQNDVSAGDGGVSTVTGGDGGGTFTSAPEETVTTEITASNSLVVADASGGDGNLSQTNQ